MDILQDFANEFGRRAAGIDEAYRVDRQRIQSDGNLSAQGKAAALAEADTRRRSAVDKLRAEGEIWLKYERDGLQRDIAKARSAYADGRRRVLGDVLTADLARRRFAALDTGALLAAVDTAPDDWHKALYSELAQLELMERAKRGDTEAESAARDTTPPALAEKERALQQLDRGQSAALADLDATAYRNRVGDAMGVNPDFVTV